MVVKMMRWRPWPLFGPRKYEVKLIVRRMEGWDPAKDAGEEKDHGSDKLTVEIRWKGPKFAFSSLRRTVKRNFTREAEVSGDENGAVGWDEEFQSVCTLSPQKENVFHPWEIAFTVFNGANRGPRSKIPTIGTAMLNLAEYASTAEQKEMELRLPLSLQNSTLELQPLLCISLILLELRTTPEEPVQRLIVPDSSLIQSAETPTNEKDELSAIKVGLRKVKMFAEYVSTRRPKKDSDEDYPFDSESIEDYNEEESDEIKEDSGVSIRKSFSYGTLAYANFAGESFYCDLRKSDDIADWVYYSNRKSDVGSSGEELGKMSEPPVLQSSKRSILPWRKRKLSFRSPKAKGEPLLKKAYGEEGGDDIDFDRRQLSSDDAGPLGLYKTDEDSSANRSSFSEFGDDNFAVGSWESREIVSRDGHMKLQTQVFFASIDQRSERAAGESACTALVAVIADWLHNNHNTFPIKSQFDSLIREGSAEWRNLCKNSTFREKFPDKHFDLETVLEAEIRPLSVAPEKSFVGFFHPEGIDGQNFDFLEGAMSFDSIWDEISSTESSEPRVYIVSWNDHFFVLKVESEAYYIIDTLGERLYEGCNEAYVLKFDRDTVIEKLANAGQPSGEKATADDQEIKPVKNEEDRAEVVCRGKDSCKDYIKNFLAAIPIRELQEDLKKGINANAPLHQRLQIEFHYTQRLESLSETGAIEMMVMPPTMESVEVAVA